MKKNLVVFQQSLLAHNTSSMGGALWFVLHPHWHVSWCGLCKPCAGSHLVERSWEQHFCLIVKKPSGSRIPGSQVLTLFLSFLPWGSLNLRCSGCNYSCPIRWGLWGQLCSLFHFGLSWTSVIVSICWRRSFSGERWELTLPRDVASICAWRGSMEWGCCVALVTKSLL